MVNFATLLVPTTVLINAVPLQFSPSTWGIRQDFSLQVNSVNSGIVKWTAYLLAWIKRQNILNLTECISDLVSIVKK